MLKRIGRHSMARIVVLVVLMAVAAFLVAGLSIASAEQGSGTLALGIKPCDPKVAPCTTAEMLVKDTVMVAIQMEHFKVENALGYDAWEATVCWPTKNLELKGDPTFKGGPLGNRVWTTVSEVSSTTSCVLVGAAVGPGEGGSYDLGNLANLDFLCKRANQDISVFIASGNVILGNGKTDGTQFGNVSIDCRSGTVSISTDGGFFTDPSTGAIHIEDGAKFKVSVSIDVLRILIDEDNPPNGAGWEAFEVSLNFTETVVGVQKDQSGDPNVTLSANIDCDNSLVFLQNTGSIQLSCNAADENQDPGQIFSAVFECVGTGATSISLQEKPAMVDESGADAGLFVGDPILIECVMKDGDACLLAEEEAINLLSQESDGVDLMDPTIYDYPDADANLNIAISDVLAYIQNFGLNNPTLGPNATGLGVVSNPPSTVHDVSHPNNDQIGTDDVLRAALLFGANCQA